MAGRRWLVAGLVAVMVGLAGVGVMASPWWGRFGGGYGPASGYGPGPGMMWGYGPGSTPGDNLGSGPGHGPGYGAGMMRGYGYGHGGGTAGSGAAGTSATASATAGPVASVTVTMDDLRYDPAQVTIAAGTTVAFVNTDTVPHNVVNATLDGSGGTPAFASPLVPPGGSWTHTFATAGTFPILCTVPGHAQAGMVGTVTVTP